MGGQIVTGEVENVELSPEQNPVRQHMLKVVPFCSSSSADSGGIDILYSSESAQKICPLT